MVLRSIVALLISAQAAYATPDAAARVSDQLLWVGADRFVVLRTTELGFSSYYTAETHFEKVDISVWDGRVISRCSLGKQRADDATADGDWVVTTSPPDAGCSVEFEQDMRFAGPLLHPGIHVQILSGVLVLRTADGKEETLADADFVASRVAAMLANERRACEEQSAGWPTFGGCFLGEDPETCEVQGGTRATKERVFLGLKCGDTDFDNSQIWLAIGRQFWDDKAN